jgi:Skp family chaperone for outer membrane proteins
MIPAATVGRSNLDNIGSSIAVSWGDRIIGADPRTSAELRNAKEQLDVLIKSINDLIRSEKAELASQGRTHIGESEKKAFAALETLKRDAESKASAVQKRLGNKETKAKAMIAKTANKPIDVSIHGGRRRKATRRRRSRKASNTRINKKARNNKSRATRRTKSRSPNRRTRHRNR